MVDKIKKLVLTIEDQPAIAELLGFLLDATELEVKRSDNGAEGLEMIQKLKPDLVIMDVMMPTMDGWQVFDTVRQNEATQNIPIIMLSVARQDPERRVAFRGSHLDFYMTKPFDVASLRRLVQEVLGLEIWIKSTPTSPTPVQATQPTQAPPPEVSSPPIPSPTVPTPPVPEIPATLPAPPVPEPILPSEPTVAAVPLTSVPPVVPSTETVVPTTPTDAVASPPKPTEPPASPTPSTPPEPSAPSQVKE
ncbi:MAG: response regulator [Anaerolineae bacterium]|nr:response regulator [Anaerolineae bacterium]